MLKYLGIWSTHFIATQYHISYLGFSQQSEEKEKSLKLGTFEIFLT